LLYVHDATPWLDFLVVQFIVNLTKIEEVRDCEMPRGQITGGDQHARFQKDLVSYRAPIAQGQPTSSKPFTVEQASQRLVYAGFSPESQEMTWV
jgi:hypothetical protein